MGPIPRFMTAGGEGKDQGYAPGNGMPLRSRTLPHG